MNDQVLANVNDDGLWVTENSSHLSKLLKITLDTLAIADGRLDGVKGVANNFETLGYLLDVFALEVISGGPDIINERLSILNAVLKVGHLST